MDLAGQLVGRLNAVVELTFLLGQILIPCLVAIQVTVNTYLHESISIILELKIAFMNFGSRYVL